MAEQAKIEAQLHELEGMKDIQVGLELTHINEDEQMRIDEAPGPPRPIEAKLRALEKFVRVAFHPHLPRQSLCRHLFALLYSPHVSDLFLFQNLIFLHFFSGQRLPPTKWRQGASIIT